MVDLAMLSAVHVIIIAEAGVKAKAENRPAAIKIFVIGTSLGKSQRIAGFRNTHPLPNTFPEENIFVCCDAMIGASSA